MKVEVPFSQVFDAFVRRIQDDPELFQAYRDNISMAFQDTLANAGYKFPDLQPLANQAAVNFLHSLFVKSEEE